MIDSSIWGSAENWNYYDQARYHDIRLPGIYRTLYRLCENNILDENEQVDNTICVSGMGVECPYSNIKYLTVDDGTLKTDEQNRSLTNWVFYNCDGFGVYTGRYRTTCLFKNNANGNYRNFSSILTEYWNGNSEITFFTDFNYKKLVLYIRVVASATETSTPSVFGLDSYLSTEYQNYPYVRYVCARLYYEQSTNPTRRTYIHDGTIEGYHYATTAILDDYETTLTTPNLNRTYCNHISESRGNNIPVLGLSFYSTAATLEPENTGRVYITYGVDDDWTINKDENNNIILCYHVTNISVFKEKALRAAAAFGCYFTGDQTTAESGALTSEKMYIGVLDKNAVAHGDYLQGTATATAKQNEWETARDSNYDPSADIDPTKYKNDTEFNLLYNASSVTTFYVLNDLQVNQLAQELYTILSNVPVDAAIEKYNQQVFLTNNAIDCIVSLKRFPLASVPSAGIAEYVKLGTQTTSIQAARLQAPAKIYYFNFSSASNTSLYPLYNKSFLDYEPYTKAKINIPFCGSVEVPCTYLYDYGGVTVALAIDFITGGCTGYVICNGIVIDSVNGQCSVELPLSGIQSSTVDSQIFSASQQKIKQETSLGLGILAGAVAIGAGIATGGLAAVAGGALAIGTSAANYIQSERELDYELTHMQAPLKQVGAASGQISELYDTRCKMVITRPKINPEFENSPEAQEAYASTIGYACLLSGIVSDFSGFTVGSIDLDGVAATAEEKEMIKNYFASGVYL